VDTLTAERYVPQPGWVVVHRRFEPVWEPVPLVGQNEVCEAGGARAQIIFREDRLHIERRHGVVNVVGPPSTFWHRTIASIGDDVLVFVDDLAKIGRPPSVTADLVISGDQRLCLRDGHMRRGRAVLIVGAPGTGKTTIARWLAESVSGRCVMIDGRKLARASDSEQHGVACHAFDRPNGEIVVVDDIDRIDHAARAAFSAIAKRITDRGSRRWLGFIATATDARPFTSQWLGHPFYLAPVQQRPLEVPAIIDATVRQVHANLRASTDFVMACMSENGWSGELRALVGSVRERARRTLAERGPIELGPVLVG
jgi:hypothetical protein